MARAVKGFLSEDGSYFESKEEAELHDTKQALSDWIAQAGLPEETLKFIREHLPTVGNYIRAVEAYYKSRAKDEKRKVSNSSDSDGL